MASKEAEEYFKTHLEEYRHNEDNRFGHFREFDLIDEKVITDAFDAGVESVITKLKDEFINKPKEDILERALDDYFSGCTHFCSNDEDIERLFSNVIDYFIRKG